MLSLKCRPKQQNWHVLGQFPSVWSWVLEACRRLVGNVSKVVGSWLEVVGGGRRWSEAVASWAEGGRKLVGGGQLEVAALF